MRKQRKMIGSAVLALAVLGGMILLVTGCADDDKGIKNTLPVLAAIGDKSVTEGETLNFNVSAADADNDQLTLWVENQPANSQFVDNANGTGSFSFSPNYTQDGTFQVTFMVSDGKATDSEEIEISVVDSAFTHHTGILSQSETWSAAANPHLVVGDIEVDSGAVLTIERGCIVYFVEGKRIRVGYYESGGLIAEGVTFTSAVKNPTEGIWDGITFAANCLPESSSLDECIVEWGGGNGYGNVYVSDGTVTITDCTLRLSAANGVYFSGEGNALSFVGNTITDNRGYPATVECNYVGRLAGSSLTGNDRDTVIVGGRLVSESTSWDTLGVPYRITRSFEIADGAVLTIVPGNTLSFDPGAGIKIGKTSAGTLVADGTENQIVFTSSKPAPSRGSWDGLWFGEFAGDGCILANCLIEYGAEIQDANIYVEDTEITINNSTIRHSDGYGVYFNGDGRFASFENNVLTENAFTPIIISGKYVGELTTSNSYTGNEMDMIEVSAGTLEGEATWDYLGVNYYVTGIVSIDNGGVLTLAAGDTLYFVSEVGLEVGATGPAGLIADGTEGGILLTAADSMICWDGITFKANTLESSLLDGCTISYGGRTKGVVSLVDCQVSISNCVISNGCATGINFEGAAYALNFEGNTVTANKKYPVSIDCDYVGYLSPNNDFSGNGENGFEVTGSQITESTTWPNPGVPYIIGTNITVGSNVQLTLSPEAELKFAREVGLTVAEYGALIADGSAGQIKFTAAESGNWTGLIFQPGASSASILKNCLIDSAGAESSYDGVSQFPGCVHVNGCVITITDCTITGTKRNGIFFYGDGYAADFHGNVIEGTTQFYPVRVDVNQVDKMTPDNTYGTGEGLAGIEIGVEYAIIDGDEAAWGRLMHSATWANLGVPYYFDGDSITVTGDAELTIEAGTSFIFFKYAELIVGGSSGQASLQAIGTALDPITFVSSDTLSTNNWGCIWLRNAGNDNSSLDHCLFEYGGKYRPGFRNRDEYGTLILSDCSPSITNCTFRKGKGYGIYCFGSSSPELENNTFEDNSKDDLGGACGP